MLPFSLFGRRLYRRAKEASMESDPYPGSTPSGPAGDGEGPPQDPEKAALAADENQNAANIVPAPLPEPEVVNEDTPMTFKIEDYITARTSDMWRNCGRNCGRQLLL